MPGILVHVHLHQHVTGEELALAATLGTLAHLDHFLRRHKYLAKRITHLSATDALFQGTLYLVFKTRIRVYHIPLQ